MNALETTSKSTLRRLGRWAAVAASILLVSTALALPAPKPGDDDNPVTIKAVPQHPAVEQGGRLVIAVEMGHQPHFHSWPAKEVKLPDSIDEFAIRTEIGLMVDEKATAAAKEAATKAKKPEAAVDAIRVYVMPAWVARIDGVQYPAAKTGKVADPSGKSATISLPLYEGNAVSYIRIDIKPDATPGEQEFTGQVSFQSCNEQMCTAPRDDKFTVKVKVVKKGEADAGLTAEPDAAIFAGFDAKKWGSGGNGGSGTSPPATSPKTGDQPKPVAPSTPPTKNSQAPTMGPSIGGVQIGGGFLVLFLVSILGGIVLDLTPCVLPVIPIKVLTLTQHTKSPHKRVVLGLWVASGVVAFWAAAGLPMALLGASLDPTKLIFGMWWVTLVLGLIIATMGLGIMGLFTISLPQAVYLVNPKHESTMGSFLSGVMTAVLGLPCFGFVAGGLLAGAATLPPLSIMAVFVGIGIGMALPYYILTVWPNLLKFIPRTGPASDLVKQVMGLFLLAGAGFFIAVGIKTLVAEYPSLGGAMNWWAATFFIALGCLWLVFRTMKITKKIVWRAGMTVVACGLLAVPTWIAYDQSFSPVAWQTYSETLLDKSTSERKVVVVDFTADWCITCKFLKSTVLNPEPVRSLLRGTNVVPLEVDLTAKSAPGWEKMKALGQTGIPTLAIYGPGIDQPIILNAYTSDMVVQAIKKAGGGPSTGASAAVPATKPLVQYTSEAFEQAVAEGKVEVICFDADWVFVAGSSPKARLCALDTGAALHGDDIVAFSANVTGKSAPGWERLKGVNQPVIPMIAVFGPGVSQPIVFNPNTHNSQELKAAIQRARGTATTLSTPPVGVPPGR